jgi:hypothetical protein
MIPALILGDLKIDEWDSGPSELQTLLSAFPISNRNERLGERLGLETTY